MFWTTARARPWRPALVGAATVLATIAGSAAAGTEAPDVHEVHYTFTGPTSVAFDWRGTPDTITYGSTVDYGSSAVASTPSPVPPSTPGPFWEVELTGLEPDTEYHYSIGGTPDQTFHTAPAGSYQFAAVGDIGDSVNYPVVTDIMSQLATEQPSFVVALGDLTYANRNCAAAVGQHFDDMQVWSRQAAYMPVWGNHEYASADASSQPCGIDDTFANYKGRFSLSNDQPVPSNGPPTNGLGCASADGSNPCRGEDWYWFDAPPVRFIAGPEPFSGAIDDWHDQVVPLMSEAATDPAIRFVVTAAHRPAYSSAPRTSADYRAAIDDLGERFAEYALHLNGHVHSNEVFEPQNGVTHVTAGGGGEGLDTLPEPVDGSVLQLERTGYALVDVGPQTLTVNIVCGPADPRRPDDDCTPGETVASFDASRLGPEAEWTASCGTLRCTLDGSTSTDPDGEITSYDWDFADGSFGTGPVVTHQFPGAGVYPVRLTVTDDTGRSSIKRRLVTVGNTGAVAFRAATEVSALARTHRLTVPGTVQAGDGLLAFLTVNSAGRTVTTPSGWQRVRTVSDQDLTTVAFQRTANGGTAGNVVQFVLNGRAKATATMLAYAGTSSSGPVGELLGAYETVNGTAHTTPRISLASPGAGLVSYWADRSTATTGWALPSGVTGRSQSAGAGTGHTAAAAGDSTGPLPAGGAGGLTAYASSKSHKATMVSVLLSPGS